MVITWRVDSDQVGIRWILLVGIPRCIKSQFCPGWNRSSEHQNESKSKHNTSPGARDFWAGHEGSHNWNGVCHALAATRLVQRVDPFSKGSYSALISYGVRGSLGHLSAFDHNSIGSCHMSVHGAMAQQFWKSEICTSSNSIKASSSPLQLRSWCIYNTCSGTVVSIITWSMPLPPLMASMISFNLRWCDGHNIFKCCKSCFKRALWCP